MSLPRPPRARTAIRLAPEDQALLQFVVLSLLLHVLVVLAFGSRSVGGDRRGDGATGSLDVTLRRLSPESGSGFTLAPGTDARSAGSALLRRLRGTPAVPAPPVPAVTAPAEPRLAPPVAPPEAPALAPEPQAAPSAAPAAFEALPRLNRDAQEEIDKPLTPPAAAPPVDRERVPPVVPVPPALPAAAIPQPDIAPRELPLPAPIERVAPAKSRSDLLPPIELPPPAPIERIAPATSKPDLLPPIELPPPAPIERIAPAKSNPDLLAPIEVPAPAPIERIAPARSRPDVLPPIELPPPAPIERIAPARSRPDVLPPIELPPPAPIERIAPATRRPELLAPIEAGPREAAVPASAEPFTPPRIERPPAPPAAAAAPRGETADTAPRAPRAAPPAASIERGPAREAPLRSGPSPAGIAAPASGGIPDAEEEAFKPRRDAADPAAVPRLDLEATRRRAREIASESPGSRGLLLVVPTPPDTVKRKQTLAEAIAKAAKPDCRDAYAELGLLAIPPLVASTVGNGGCRW